MQQLSDETRNNLEVAATIAARETAAQRKHEVTVALLCEWRNERNGKVTVGRVDNRPIYLVDQLDKIGGGS